MIKYRCIWIRLTNSPWHKPYTRVIMIKQFLSYYKKQKVLFSLDMIASLFLAALAMLYPILTRLVLNDYVPNNNINMILVSAGILFAVYTIRMILNAFIQDKGHVMGAYIENDMRDDLFSKLQKLPFRYFDQHQTGDIMSRMTNDLFSVTELAHHGPETAIISSVTFIGALGYLMSINLWLALIIFCCAPILIIVTVFSRKKLLKSFKASSESKALINTSIESSVSGIRVTKAFNNHDNEFDKFCKSNKEFLVSRKEVYKNLGKFTSRTTYIVDLFNMVVLLAGGLFVLAGVSSSDQGISIGDYTAFIISVGLIITPISQIINFVEQFQNGAAGFRRFMTVMNEEEESDAIDAIELDNMDGDIKFSNVSFSYENDDLILNDISFNIKAGEKIALVGASGGGKTTICHLLPRFYNITNGNILIDDIDINHITLKSLRQNIGIVQQDVFLFDGSIKENIAYGNLNASVDEIMSAAQKSNIHEFVSGLPEGYDTQIGERGVKLSGGQKQRLSIARIFLKNPSILILDEATSALDNSTERLIQSEFDELSKGRTTIVVAHRLSTVKNADRIMVIENGKVAECGSHEELLLLKSKYYQLHSKTSDIIVQ